MRGRVNTMKLLRVSAMVVADVLAVNLASFLALFLRFNLDFGELAASGFVEAIMRFGVANTLLTVAVYTFLKLYRSVWEFAGMDELVRLAVGVIISTLLQVLLMFALRISLPRSYPFIYLLLLGLFSMVSRFSYRLLRRERAAFRRHAQKRTMLVGAGAAGAMVLREFRLSGHSENAVVCAIDDDPAKKGSYLMDVKIVGDRSQIKEAAQRYEVEEIVLAIPTATNNQRLELLAICQETGCTLKTIPALYQLANGDVSLKEIRDVQIEDLLGRAVVKVDMAGIREYITGKTVLVTGGGGSIGSELCRQVASHGPRQLIIFDIYENNAYEIQQDLRRTCPGLNMTVLIGSVRDRARIFNVMGQYRPDLVIHAAAHKHVPLMEDSPAEAIKNNVFGTLNTAEAADAWGVQRFILISTDKAVNPTNVMGASKRLCEMVIQMVNDRSETEFVAVRFGNVLGSNGSVIPLFRKQILSGGPVTVTDKNVIRYFMTIPEAVSLVLQAGAYAHGGEIFVLDMGEPVRIDDLARNMIRLSGYEPDVDIQVIYTGLRPGEKLFEEILMDSEGMEKTANDLIYIGRETPLEAERLTASLAELRQVEETDTEAVKDAMARAVSTYIRGRSTVAAGTK